MSELIVSRQQRVLLLTLNRPAARNALNNALLMQLVNELEAAATDTSISVCVITGNARFFAAGADLNEMAEKDLAATLNDTRPQLWARLPGTARTMRRMDRISGRSDDMLIIRGVNVFPSQLEEEIVKFEHLSPHYQLEVNRRGHLDSLSVKVELKESSLTLTHEQRCQVCHQLRHRIKSMVGISTDVMIVNCGSIPRSEGKACRVFDLRNIVGA